VTDPEKMKPTILSAAKEEIHSILQALTQVEKNLKDHSGEAEKMKAIMAKTKRFYEEMDKIMELMNKYTTKELTEILESKKN
jgi:hypothetical protein